VAIQCTVSILLSSGPTIAGRFWRLCRCQASKKVSGANNCSATNGQLHSDTCCCAMRSVLSLVLLALSAVVTASTRHHHHSHKHHASTKSTTQPESKTSWYQRPHGNATFTRYQDCQSPSCGLYTYGHTAAVNPRTFGSWQSAGGACGLCFKITPTYDPYSPKNQPPYGNSIVVKVTDLCPFSNPTDESDPRWCNQKTDEPYNKFGGPVQCGISFPIFVKLCDIPNEKTMAASICATIHVRMPGKYFSVMHTVKVKI